MLLGCVFVSVCYHLIVPESHSVTTDGRHCIQNVNVSYPEEPHCSYTYELFDIVLLFTVQGGENRRRKPIPLLRKAQSRE